MRHSMEEIMDLNGKRHYIIDADTTNYDLRVSGLRFLYGFSQIRLAFSFYFSN